MEDPISITLGIDRYEIVHDENDKDQDEHGEQKKSERTNL